MTPEPTPVPRNVGAAVAQLAQHQKTSKGAPAYSRLVNRKVGRWLAAVAYVIGLTPNQVTGLSALCTFSAIGLIAGVDPTPLVGVVVAVLLALGYALDSADGQLARLRGGGSVIGEWLDHVVDATKIASLHLAVLVSWYRFLELDDAWLTVPILFQITASVTFFVVILNDQIRRAHRGTTDMLLAGDGSSSVWYSLAVVPTDYGLLCWVFLLMGAPTAFRWVYTALMLANLAFLGLALLKWSREMRRY